MTNKSLVQYTVIFIGGLSCGYMIAKNVLQKKYQEDVAEVKDFYMAKLDEMGVMPSNFNPKDLVDSILEYDEDGVEDDVRATEEYFEETKKYSSAATEGASGTRGKGKPIINYNKPPLIVEEYGELEEDEDEEDFSDEEYEAEIEARSDEYAKRRSENKAKGLPYVINHDEFEEASDDYTQETFYYYAKDRVLCEDDDTMIEDEEDLVGLDYEDILSMQTTAWVRNDGIGVVYEIHRIDESYHSSVGNVVETPMERDFRIKGRRKQGMDA